MFQTTNQTMITYLNMIDLVPWFIIRESLIWHWLVEPWLLHQSLEVVSNLTVHDGDLSRKSPNTMLPKPETSECEDRIATHLCPVQRTG